MKKYFITGLLVWVPLGITFWVLALTISTMDQTLQLLPDAWHHDKQLGVHIPGWGIILTLEVLLLAGMMARKAPGQRVRSSWNGALRHLHLVKRMRMG